MSLGEIGINALCELMGEAAHALLNRIFDEARKELHDEDLVIYGFAYMYGINMIEEADRLKIRRKIGCIDAVRITNVDHDENRIYIRKPSEEEVDKALKVAMIAIRKTLRSLLGDAVKSFIKYIARELVKSFKGPNEVVLRLVSEMSRNPYNPKLNVEIEGRKIIVRSVYPIKVDEQMLAGTVLPFILAYAAAMMMGREEVILKDARIVGENMIVMEFEAVRFLKSLPVDPL